jgi:hypothetical protein
MKRIRMGADTTTLIGGSTWITNSTGRMHIKGTRMRRIG